MCKINVVYICNDTYFPMTGISIKSLLENNRNAEEINVYMGSDNISPQNLSDLDSLVNEYNRKLTVIDVSDIFQKLEDAGVKKYKGATYSPYIKNLMTQKVPTEEKRLLYLDSDTIIDGSIEELFTMELSKPLYMVIDIMWDFYKEKLGLNKSSYYFNGGLILYNLDVWRKENCAERYLDYLQHCNKQYVLGDQDITNVLFNEQIGVLDLKYNYYSNYYLINPKYMKSAVGVDESNYYSGEEMEEAKKSVAIYHCAKYNGERVWDKKNNHPFSEIYKRYKSISYWKNEEGWTSNKSKAIKIQLLLQRWLPHRVYIIFLRRAQKQYFKKNEILLNQN